MYIGSGKVNSVKSWRVKHGFPLGIIYPLSCILRKWYKRRNQIVSEENSQLLGNKSQA